MTLRQFYAKFRKHTANSGLTEKFHEKNFGLIRCFDMCPITFVTLKETGREFFNINFQWAAGHIGLSNTDAHDIMHAADRTFPHRRAQRIRKQLLKIVETVTAKNLERSQND